MWLQVDCVFSTIMCKMSVMPVLQPEVDQPCCGWQECTVRCCRVAKECKMEQMSLNLETRSPPGYLMWSHTHCMSHSLSLLLVFLFYFLSFPLSLTFSSVSVFSYFVFSFSFYHLILCLQVLSVHFLTSVTPLVSVYLSSPPPSVSHLTFTDCLWFLDTNPLLWPLDIKLLVRDNQQSNKYLYLQLSSHASQHQCLFRPGPYCVHSSTESLCVIYLTSPCLV